MKGTLDFLAVALPLGLLLGAILNAVVLRTSWSRKHRRPGEAYFLLLVAATLIFDLSAFLALFTHLVYVRDSEVRFLTSIFDAGVLLGLGVIPSLLLHTALGFVRPERVPAWVNPLLYLPIVTLNPALVVFQSHAATGLMPVLHQVIGAYSIWMALVCGVTGTVAYKVSRRDRRPTTAQLTYAMSTTLSSIAAVWLAAFALGGWDWPLVGDYLNLAGLLAPNGISIGLAIYVYRYPDIADALQRGFYNMSLALLVLCLYFFGIRELAQRLGTMQLNWEVMEALMLVGLVWAFHPLRNMAQQLYAGVFLRQVARYQETFRRLGRGLSEAYVPDLPFVLSQAAGVVQEALAAERAAIYLLSARAEGLEVVHGHPRPFPKDLPLLAERVVPYGETFVDRFELEDKPLAEIMDLLDADGVYAFYREGSIAGLIVLGHRGVDRQLGREERELLSFVGHSLADAIHKNALVEQKVRLEREIAQSERMSSLGRLAAGVAHEIKNPLSTIKSIIEVMEEEAGPESPLKEDLEVISEEIARLDSTVKNLLEFIRPDERRDKLVSVESVLQGVLHILDYEARKAQVVIATRLSERAHYVRGLSEELKSIFFNLVLNAIQAMAETGGTLTVITRPLAGGDGEASRRVEVVVQDTGPGIPESRRDQIFRPFYTDGKEEGTGLGLAIVRQKVSACEGEIHFETGGQGTSFFVRLPVAGRTQRKMRGEEGETPGPGAEVEGTDAADSDPGRIAAPGARREAPGEPASSPPGPTRSGPMAGGLAGAPARPPAGEAEPRPTPATVAGEADREPPERAPATPAGLPNLRRIK